MNAPEGRRSTGRPKRRWWDQVQKCMGRWTWMRTVLRPSPLKTVCWWCQVPTGVLAMTSTVSIFGHEIVWKKASPIIEMSLCSNLMELAKIDYIYWMKDLFYIFRVTPSDLSSTLVPSISAVHRRAIFSVCSGTLLEYRIDSGGESLRMKKRLMRNYVYILKYRVYRPIKRGACKVVWFLSLAI